MSNSQQSVKSDIVSLSDKEDLNQTQNTSENKREKNIVYFDDLEEIEFFGNVNKNNVNAVAKKNVKKKKNENNENNENKKNKKKKEKKETNVNRKKKVNQPIVFIEENYDDKIGKTNVLQSINPINKIKDITGMSLTYPNPITGRLEQRMPRLFGDNTKNKINDSDSYIRMCPNSVSNRRQPIILTKEEKDEMMREGQFDEEADFISYGSDENDNPYYYTCPKYWCLLTEKVVTEQDILDGKCGPKVDKIEDAIIPKKAETVPEGKYVYKFYDEDGKKYPGFHKENTSTGLCAPCCYKNWDTPGVKERRDNCQAKQKQKEKAPPKYDVKEKEKEKEKAPPKYDVEEKEEEKGKNVDEIKKYIKDPEKYGPGLGEQRWGWLPMSIQKLLKQKNQNCQVSKSNTYYLKMNTRCLLRFGVEHHPTQSFIACIASVLFYTKSKIPTITEMKQRIINSLNLDNFIKYQNGDLITSFSNPDLEVNIRNYSKTKLYQKMIAQKSKVDNKKTKNFIKKVAQSLEHFKNFLMDDKIKIDHTYLWDIICMPNPNIFTEGANLIILEISQNDQNNVELLCPTNHYSSHMYDNRKQSIILIKRENYFEPVYARLDGETIKIIKTFLENDTDLPESFRNVLKTFIGPNMNDKCKPFPSMKDYRFKKAPLLDILIEELHKKKYSITQQVLNYQGKVIGVLAKNNKKFEGFIPCFPSSLTNLKTPNCHNEDEKKSCEHDFVYMDDNIWKTYEETLEFLKSYYNDTKDKSIHFFRVAEDDFIIGFITNTEHFIPIISPVPLSSNIINDEVYTIESNNLLDVDINTLTIKSADNERINYIKRTQLETNFYNVFRNTVRILLNQNANNQKRENLKKKCEQRNIIYSEQLKSVIELLQDLIHDNIIFASNEDLPYKYNDIDDKDIYSCVLRKKETCQQTGSICRVTEKGCKLVLPKYNLLNKGDNEKFYYNRMADELIRYNKINSFIFKPQGYLSFGQVKYNLRNDEIILLQDNITQEYFENLIPSEINEYAKYNTFDTANPIKSLTYNNNISYKNITKQKQDKDSEEKQDKDSEESSKKEPSIVSKPLLDDVEIILIEPPKPKTKKNTTKKCPEGKELNENNRCVKIKTNKKKGGTKKLR
jgi:hypothetical protein